MKVIKPTSAYFDAYYEACKESYDNNITEWMPFDPQNYEQWKSRILEVYNNYETGNNIPEQMPRTYTYWCIENEAFIGEIQVRPFITEAQAKEWGHLSYAIRYAKWNQGYGTKLLTSGLEIAKEFELNKVYIACREDNFGSIRVIEKNKGVFIKKIAEEDGTLNNVYFIEN